jgi:hypothetical protein
MTRTPVALALVAAAGIAALAHQGLWAFCITLATAWVAVQPNRDSQ